VSEPRRQGIEVPSFGSVTDFERRLYRIDRIRLNPSGVPFRGLLYLACCEALIWMLAALPPFSLVLDVLPWYFQFLGVPIGLAYIFTVAKLEGRFFHRAIGPILRHRLGAKHLTGFTPTTPIRHRWTPEQLICMPDGSDGRLRRLRYHGPGHLLIRPAHECLEWTSGPLDRLLGRPHLTLRGLARPAPSQAKVLALAEGTRVDIQPARRRTSR
jgi:hypothetical protein